MQVLVSVYNDMVFHQPSLRVIEDLFGDQTQFEKWDSIYDGLASWRQHVQISSGWMRRLRT